MRFILDFLHTLLQELFIILHFFELLSKIFWLFLLFLGLVTNTRNLRLNLKDIVLLLLDEFFDSLKSFISLLHTKKRFLPVIKKSFLWHYDLFNFNSSFFKSVSCSCSFFLLWNQLGLIQSLLLIQSLDLFIHRVNEHILSLLLLFKVDNWLFSTVCSSSCNSNFRLHDLVVFLNLLQSSVQLVEFFLSLEYPLKLIISFFFLSFVLFL